MHFRTSYCTYFDLPVTQSTSTGTVSQQPLRAQFKSLLTKRTNLNRSRGSKTNLSCRNSYSRTNIHDLLRHQILIKPSLSLTLSIIWKYLNFKILLSKVTVGISIFPFDNLSHRSRQKVRSNDWHCQIKIIYHRNKERQVA